MIQHRNNHIPDVTATFIIPDVKLESKDKFSSNIDVSPLETDMTRLGGGNCQCDVNKVQMPSALDVESSKRIYFL